MLNFVSMSDAEVLARTFMNKLRKKKEGLYIVTETFKWNWKTRRFFTG